MLEESFTPGVEAFVEPYVPTKTSKDAKDLRSFPLLIVKVGCKEATEKNGILSKDARIQSV